MKKSTFLLAILVLFTISGCLSSRSSGEGDKIIHEIEPNDTYAQAQEITLGDTVIGNFSHEDDLDLYKFTVTEKGIVTAWTESKIDIYTLDINEYRNNIFYDFFRGFYIDGWEGDKRVEALLEPGTYAFELEGFETGEYKLITQFALSVAVSLAKQYFDLEVEWWKAYHLDDDATMDDIENRMEILEDKIDALSHVEQELFWDELDRLGFFDLP